MDLDVRRLGDEIYALPPPSFTAARDAHIAEAKRVGDRAAASALGAMKRPSVSAWLVNLFALRRSDALGELLALGDSMRAAGAAQLRDLSARRRREIDSILGVVRSLAADAGGPTPTAQHLVEVESTLAAAMADPAAADLVRSARLVKALSHSGFGAVGPGGTAAAPPSAAAAPGAAEDARAEALAAAQERVDAARDALAAAVAAERDLNADADRLSAQIGDLKERLDAVHRDARAARQTRLAAERDLASAERRQARVT